MIYLENEDKFGEAAVLANLGNIARIRGNFAKAEALYQGSLFLYRGLGFEKRAATVLNNLDKLQKDCNNLDEAGAK